MNGATLNLVISSPLIPPTTVPTASEMTITGPDLRVEDHVERVELPALQQDAGDDAGEAHDRADRQVDAAGQDHQEHARGRGSR